MRKLTGLLMIGMMAFIASCDSTGTSKANAKTIYYTTRPTSVIRQIKTLKILTNKQTIKTNYVDSEGKTNTSITILDIKTNYYLKWSSVNANWGEKLETLSPLLEVKDLTTGREFVNIMTSVSKSKGFIRKSTLVANPISRGVILNKTTLYSKPSYTSDKSRVVYPTTLVYVTETNMVGSDMWAKITPILLWGITNSYITAQYEEVKGLKDYWIELSQISRKDSDVDLIIGTMLAMRGYRNSPQETKDKDKATTLIDTLVKKYSNSGGVLYAQEALQMIDPTSTDIEDSEGNPLLDEDLSADEEITEESNGIVEEDSSLGDTTTDSGETIYEEDEEL